MMGMKCKVMKGTKVASEGYIVGLGRFYDGTSRALVAPERKYQDGVGTWHELTEILTQREAVPVPEDGSDFREG